MQSSTVRPKPAAGVAALAGLLALACGGEGEGADPGVLDTGLDESRSLASVSETEARQACERTEQTFNARFGPSVIARAGCEGQSAAQTSDPAACRSAADECVAMDASPIEDADVPDFECDGSAIAESCSATVGEYERCVNDVLDTLDTALAFFSCDNAAEITLLTLLQNAPTSLELPASCAVIQTACPDMLAL